MNSGLKIRILHQDASVCEFLLGGPLEIGRQRTGEPEPYHFVSGARLIVALQQDKDNISRRHLTLTPLPHGPIRISNHSQVALERANGTAINPGATLDLEPPFDLLLPARILRVVSAESADLHGIHSLAEPTGGPGAASDLSLDPRSVSLLQPTQMRALLEGVPRALYVLQSAIGASNSR